PFAVQRLLPQRHRCGIHRFRDRDLRDAGGPLRVGCCDGSGWAHLNARQLDPFFMALRGGVPGYDRQAFLGDSHADRHRNFPCSDSDQYPSHEIAWRAWSRALETLGYFWRFCRGMAMLSCRALSLRPAAGDARPMMTVYSAPNTRAIRVIWVLDEIGAKAE